jgi:putative flippase GtrA
METYQVGALVNWAVTVNLIQKFLISPTVAALIGVGAGMGFNFVFSRYIIFRSSIVGPSKK